MEKPPETATAELAEAGVSGFQTRGTVLLNDLVDWKHIHAYLASRRVAA